MFFKKKKKTKSNYPAEIDMCKQAYIQLLIARGVDLPDNESGHIVYVDPVVGRAQCVPEEIIKTFT